LKFIKAGNLEDAWYNFEPSLSLPFPKGEPFFVQRDDYTLERMRKNIIRHKGTVKKFFLCGHTGSGKSTELNRLAQDRELNETFFVIKALAEGLDINNLTYIDLLLLMGFEIHRTAVKDSNIKVPNNLKKELEDWSIKVVKTFDKNDSIEAEVRAGAGAWITSFWTRMKTRSDYKTQKKQVIDPKLGDLITIIDNLAIHIKNKTGKPPLMIFDDLEKGTSLEKKKELFSDNYSNIAAPRLHALLTLPVAFRAMPGNEIPADQIYTYPSVKIYEMPTKKSKKTVWNLQGKQTMARFIETRIDSKLIDENARDEIILIGNGIFKETCRAMQLAIDHAEANKRGKVTQADAEFVFNEIKKDFQPMLRDDEVAVCKNVLKNHRWTEGVEPLIYANAVVEYENADVWLDLRHSIKDLVARY